jgi:hypothetical protein
VATVVVATVVVATVVVATVVVATVVVATVVVATVVVAMVDLEDSTAFRVSLAWLWAPGSMEIEVGSGSFVVYRMAHEGKVCGGILRTRRRCRLTWPVPAQSPFRTLPSLATCASESPLPASSCFALHRSTSAGLAMTGDVNDFIEIHNRTGLHSRGPLGRRSLLGSPHL